MLFDFPSDFRDFPSVKKRPQIGVHGSTDDQKAEWAACALDVRHCFPRLFNPRSHGLLGDLQQIKRPYNGGVRGVDFVRGMGLKQ